jgi:hypothetical protein
MNKIATYKDLQQQEEQLEALLKAQRELLTYDFQQLKNELKPAKAALSMISKVTTREKGNLILTDTANNLIDLVVKRIILNKAGWLTRLTVPFFLKNVSSHYIADHKNEWFKKLFSWISHRNGNGKSSSKEQKHDMSEGAN